MCYCFYSRFFLTKACTVIFVFDILLVFPSTSLGGHLIRPGDSLITDTRSPAVRFFISGLPSELSDETSWTGKGNRKYGRPRCRRAHIAALEIRISERDRAS